MLPDSVVCSPTREAAMKKLSGICAAAVAVLASVWSQEARAQFFFITPTFDSAPAVISNSGAVDNSTIIMALKVAPGGTTSFPTILRNSTGWRLGTAELTMPPSGTTYDTGPTAVKSGSLVIFCGHQAGNN